MTNNLEATEPFGADDHRKARNHSVKDAEKTYDQILNRLWAGNGGGSLAVLGIVGAGKFSSAEMLPAVVFFLLGLVFLGLGAFRHLFLMAKITYDLEETKSPLDRRADLILRPTERIGLRLYDPRMITTMLAATMFTLGAGYGLLLVCKTLF